MIRHLIRNQNTGLIIYKNQSFPNISRIKAYEYYILNPYGKANNICMNFKKLMQGFILRRNRFSQSCNAKTQANVNAFRGINLRKTSNFQYRAFPITRNHS